VTGAPKTGPFGDPRAVVDTSPPDRAEVDAVARGMATAVAPAAGLTDVQATLLGAVTKAVTGFDVEYVGLEPLSADELARVLARRGRHYRQRIVQHMVLGELVLAPIPEEVAHNVAAYADALGVDDDFVRVARRYAKGALGLAWNDLRRSGFTERWSEDRLTAFHSKAALSDPFEETAPDPELEARWRAFAELDDGTLGRAVWQMYQDRGFQYPGSLGAASPFLAQHDFVHVLADYGTTMEGELEVFAFVGRADPDPKGFAWLATMVGLFETGHVHAQGPFEANVRERHLRIAGMGTRLADAIWRGKVVAEQYGHDLFDVDFHARAARSVEEVRDELHVPEKSPEACAAGSPGLFSPDGLSEFQREAARRLAGAGSA
jgi:hypothetical protein